MPHDRAVAGATLGERDPSPRAAKRCPVTVYLSPKQHDRAQILAGSGSISRVLARGLAVALRHPPESSSRSSRKQGEIKTTVLLSQSLHSRAKRAFSKGSMQDLLVHGLELLVNGSR